MRTPRQQFRTAPWVLAVVVAFGVALVAQPAAAQEKPKGNDAAAKPKTPPPAKADKAPPAAPKKAKKGGSVSGKGKLAPAKASKQSKLHAAASRGKGIPEPTVVLKPGEVPKIKFDAVSWDFGRVPAGTAIEHEYWFTNTGTGPLEILRVKPG